MNDAATRLLETARRGELHHAVILTSPSRELLRTLAIAIAKALNCLNGTTGDDCTACARIDRRTHPDVHVIEVEGDRKMISVEQVRSIVEDATLRPYEGRTKVFIIDPIDAVSVSGANSLLKTLEEPSRDTTFLLLTRSPDLLLPTIRSRSQAIFVGGEAEVDEELARSIRAGLARYAERNDSAALLAIASLVASHESSTDALALLADILCDAVASRSPNLPPERLLAAADAIVQNVRWLAVNADVRMLAEQALAKLVTG